MISGSVSIGRGPVGPRPRAMDNRGQGQADVGQSTQSPRGDRGTGVDGAGVHWREDWPPPGGVPDREMHDQPHPASGMEWWWLTAGLSDGTDDLGLACQFIRHSAPTPQGAAIDSHAVVWYLSSRDARRHVGESWLDQGVVDLATAVLHADAVIDDRVRRAMLGELANARLPQPDRRFTRPVRWNGDGLDLDFGGVARLRREPDGALVAGADGDDVGFRLRFAPGKPAIPQHVSAPGPRTRGGTTYTYCVPRMEVEGTLRDGAREFAAAGLGRFEHAFGDSWYRPAE